MAIVLASKSPRRSELLRQLGITEFLVLPAVGEEYKDPALSPEELVEALSRQKAEEVAAARGAEDVIIGADTVVAVDGTVLGKPHDEAEAEEMLSRLSGRHHKVCTGVTVIRGTERRTAHAVTEVEFRPMTREEIRWYISTGEPMDKAGAYGIQGLGARFIPAIRGDYSNVVGLPLCLLDRLLTEINNEPAGR